MDQAYQDKRALAANQQLIKKLRDEVVKLERQILQLNQSDSPNRSKMINTYRRVLHSKHLLLQELEL